MSRHSWFLFIFIFSFRLVAQQDSTLMAETKISLLTCDPGMEIYSLFGHSAIRVKNQNRDLDIVYNYGTFDFDTPGFTLKFMRGKLPYKLTVSTYAGFLQEYHYYQRGVREQVLQINDGQKEELIRFLENNARPENAEYKYDFFFDNCSSRIRDVFENTIHYPQQYSGESKLTFRNLLHRYLVGWPWLRTGIDIIIGSRADQIANASAQMFIPDKLHDNLATARLQQGQNLLSDTYDVLIFDRKARAIWLSPLVFNFMMMIGIVALFYFKKERMLDVLFKVWHSFALTGAVLITFLWFFTDHQATKLNYNFLWLNPVYVLYFTRHAKVKWVTTVVLIACFLLAYFNDFLGWIPQQMPVAYFTWAFLLLVWKLKKYRVAATGMA